MAKWGEGDPRWIVEERPDATNVNNWHWTEKNAGPWSIDKLRELLNGIQLQQDDGPLTANLLPIPPEKVRGEASANNRKGKLIFFYEWHLDIEWEGRVAGSEETEPVRGKIEVPNLSDENSMDDIEITVTVKENTENSLKLKEFMHRVGREKIRSQLALYVGALRKEFSKGMILPKKDGVEQKIKPDTISNITSGFNKKISMNTVVSSEAKPAAGVKLDVTTIKLKQSFQCRAQEFYNVMTSTEMVMAFTRGAVTLNPVKNGKFVLFGGNISGEFLELEPGKKIVQLWRYSKWPESHHSNVTIDIKEESDHTSISLTQTGVPTSDVEMTKQNWERYYWESIKRTFGFGTFF